MSQKSLFEEVYGPKPKESEEPTFGDSDDRFNDGEHDIQAHAHLTRHAAPPEYDQQYQTYRTEGG